MGFCFGHQAIAVACGGVVVEGDRGSELGVYAARVTREGKDFFRTTAGQADLEVAVSVTDRPADQCS
jgi:GMP synthase-like glutamine amidotransferase